MAQWNTMGFRGVGNGTTGFAVLQTGMEKATGFKLRPPYHCRSRDGSLSRVTQMAHKKFMSHGSPAEKTISHEDLILENVIVTLRSTCKRSVFSNILGLIGDDCAHAFFKSQKAICFDTKRTSDLLPKYALYHQISSNVCHI
mmetsp:Transcript_44280/g.60499  ORF Transcript_44280/g.60499 Transcript_44280/m.60499 type:complete len:142 (-) Transcript_44280:553-978(-)